MDRPQEFALEAALEDLVCPDEDRMWRWCSCLGSRDSGRTRYSGELVARNIAASRKYSALEGYGDQYWPICSSMLAWRTTPSLTEESRRPQSTESQQVGHYGRDPVRVGARHFLPEAALLH